MGCLREVWEHSDSRYLREGTTDSRDRVGESREAELLFGMVFICTQNAEPSQCSLLKKQFLLPFLFKVFSRY